MLIRTRSHRFLIALLAAFAVALGIASMASAAVGPGVEITAGPESAETVAAGQVEFEFTATVPDASFECRVDGSGEWAACSSPAAATFSSAGWHSFSVRALAGGVTGQALTRQFQAEVPPAPKTVAADLTSTHAAAIPSTTSALARQGVKVTGICSADCHMSVRLVLSRAAARAAGLPTVLSVRSFDLAAGASSEFRVRLTDRLAKVLVSTGSTVRGLSAKVHFSPAA